jgi:uncharacterized protein with von Willebrand factor type A (vWA) domain
VSNYQSYSTITESIVGFAEYARANELNVGIRETQEALLIASAGLLPDKVVFRYALKSVFCSSEENTVLFDQLFTDFWGMPKASFTHRMNLQNQTNLQKQSQRSLVLMGKGNDKDGKEEDGKNMSGANSIETIRKTDFSKLSEIDSEYLEKLALDLWKQMSKRLKKSTTKGNIDIRQTIRTSIGKGGAMYELQEA